MEKVDVKTKVLADNEAAAARLRGKFEDQGTLVVNLISSPGAGKTTLLEKTLAALRNCYHLGVLVGDVDTDRDARRLKAPLVRVRQIITGGACHLDARLVDKALQSWNLDDLDILFIENVGNLICPTAYDLGEDFKVVLLSVTEGDDKVFKYPGIFSRAEMTLITKWDLRPHVEFDLAEVRAEVVALNPYSSFLVLSAKTGEGMAKWLDFLKNKLEAKRVEAVGTGAGRVRPWGPEKG